MHFGYPAYRTAAFLSRTLPTPISYRLAKGLAGLCRRLSPNQQRAVARNLKRILAHRGETLSDPDLHLRVRDTYRAFGKYMADFFRYSVSDPHELVRRVTLEGETSLQDALARGRGVLLATAHLGNWELGALHLALQGYPLTVAYRPMASPRINRLLLDQRTRRGMEALPLGRAARSLVRTLREGRMAALLADRDFTENPISTSFFGAPALLPRGPAVLSFRTGAPLLPVFMLRRPDDGFRLTFKPPIDPTSFASAESVHAALAREMEEVIGEHPDQWFLFDDFWPGGQHEPASGESAGLR